MTADVPPDDLPSLAAEWREQRQNQSTKDRVYTAALQLYDATRVKEVAEQAEVSKETARDYLKWFCDLGVLEQTAESPDMFKRNEQYFEWRRIERLQQQSEEELIARLEELTQQEQEYRDRYDADDPSSVDALSHADYDELEAVWRDIQEWRTIRRRIEELEQARQRRDEADRAPA
jgi:transposase